MEGVDRLLIGGTTRNRDNFSISSSVESLVIVMHTFALFPHLKLMMTFVQEETIKNYDRD